jgi:DMSO/TMAO reductase YedYZ molybdopterin-dependent catalytic subunit
VLHVGAVPRFDREAWDFRVGGLVESPFRLSYRQFVALPQRQWTSDFHCVTRWSTFDNRWQGVAAGELLARARPRPEARFVMALGHVGELRYGYASNLLLADLERDGAGFALLRNGRDIPPDHGGPVRLVVPHLYGWKSCKWVRGLILMENDRPGYWERAGYHMRGDPFGEQRFG